MTIKVVEYENRYEESDGDVIIETLYAVRQPGVRWTAANGDNREVIDDRSWVIDGTTLHIYDRQSLLGYLALLNKLLDEEFPESE